MSVGGVSSVDRALAQVAPGAAPSPSPSSAAATGEVAASPAARSVTEYAPAAGIDAGSADGGGLVDDGLARTAATGAGMMVAQGQRAGAGQDAQAIADQQQVVSNPAASAASGVTQAPAGPAAWNDEWNTKFADAGAPPELLQQLAITGANGADQAQLQQMLDQVKGEVDKVLAEFAAKHPDAFKKLRSNSKVDRATLAQIAQAVNTGQVKDEELDDLVKQAGMTQGKMLRDMFFKQMLPWMVIPGWGALRFGLSPLFGGKDPISGEKIHLDFWNHGFQGWMDALMAAGGTMTLINNVRGAMQIAQGNKLIANAAAGSDIAKIAAREGVSNLTGFAKFKSYIPGTSANRAVAGISRFNDELVNGIAKLSGEPRQLADLVMSKWKSGEITVTGDPAVRFTKMGTQPNVRGALPMVGNRSKAMFQWINKDGKTILALDGRMTGKSLAAHFAAAGTNLAESGVLKQVEQQMLSQAAASGKSLAKPALAVLQNQVLAEATKQLGLTAPSNPIARLWGMWRPGPLQDALKAVANPTGELGGVAKALATPGVKPALIGLGVVGAGFGFYKFQQSQAAAAAAQQQPQAQQPGGGGVAAQGAQMTPELQQVIAQLQQMTPQQQQQVLQQQASQLQAAAQQPNLSDADKAAIQQGYAELEMVVSALTSANATGGAGPAADAAQGAQLQQQSSPSTTGAPALPTPDTLTPQGLGLNG